MVKGTNRITHWATFRQIDIPVIRLAELIGMSPSTLIARCKGRWNIEAAVFAKPNTLVTFATSNAVAAQEECKQFCDALEPKVRKLMQRKHTPKIQKSKVQDKGDIERILALLEQLIKERK